MTDAKEPLTARPIRRDGWTAERRRRFLKLLAAGLDVRRACAGVALSRQAAYTLRRREPAFAESWDGAMRSARVAAEQAWIAMLPEGLRRRMSELSGECNLREPCGALYTLSELWRARKLRGDPAWPPRTLSELWRACKLRARESGF